MAGSNAPNDTESGNLSNRVYVSLIVDTKRKGQMGIAFLQRASDLIAPEIDEASGYVSFEDYWSGHAVWISPQTWEDHQDRIRGLIGTLASRWQDPSQKPEESSAAAT